MNDERAFFTGWLLIPPIRKLPKKNWQQKYCILYDNSKFGVKRLEIHDDADEVCSNKTKIITLEDVIKVSSSGPTHFAITTRNSSLPFEFIATTNELKENWLIAIQSVAFSDIGLSFNSFEEDNDLYCSSADGIFQIRFSKSMAADRCSISYKHPYTLIVGDTSLQLRDIEQTKAAQSSIRLTWPYCFIRRYGYKSGKFMFEAGRKCQSGEGVFLVEHSNLQELYRCVSTKMKFMKRILGNVQCRTVQNDSHTNSNNIIETHGRMIGTVDEKISLHNGDDDSCLQAVVVSLEPRSRSPLTPSFSSTLKCCDSSNSSPSVIDAQKTPTPPTTPLTPTCLPSSSLPHPNTISNEQEPIMQYSNVELRHNAWRTFGINNVQHEECVTNLSSIPNDETAGKPSILEKIPNDAPKVLTVPINSRDGYDRLEFFGAISKMQGTDYKKLEPSRANSLSHLHCSATNRSDDDILFPSSLLSINTINDISEIRLANDSHRGYALIRKDMPVSDGMLNANRSENQEMLLTRNSSNHSVLPSNESYAIISKAKRV